MNPLSPKTMNTEQNHHTSAPIKVCIIGIPEVEASKLKRILKLSTTRSKKYIEVEADLVDQASMIITADLNHPAQAHQAVVFFGNQKPEPDTAYTIQPPLMSIRVLRVLDGIEINPVIQQDTVATEIALDHSTNTQSTVNSLPAEAIVSPPVPSEPVASVASNEDVLSFQVLIVDDSVLIHRALDIELSKAAFMSNTDYAESGEDCLTLVGQNQYDIIFLDVMMPGIDGFETCTEIRKKTNYKKVPIIMLSAKTSPLDEVKGVMAGCTTYLTKPIKHDAFQKLLSRMGKWLENYKIA